MPSNVWKGYAGTDTAWTFDEGDVAQEASQLLGKHGFQDGQRLLIVCPGACGDHLRYQPGRWLEELIRGRHSPSFSWAPGYFWNKGPRADGANAQAEITRAQALGQAIREIKSQWDVSPLIIGMQGPVDIHKCRLVAAELDDAPVLSSEEHAIEVIVVVLRKAYILISARYHACVLSMPAGVPAIGIRGDLRFERMLGAQHRLHLLVPEKHVNGNDKAKHYKEQFLHAFECVNSNHAEFSQQTEQFVVQQLHMMSGMGQELARIIKTAYPDFPIETNESWENFLPPLSERLKRLLNATTQEGPSVS